MTCEVDRTQCDLVTHAGRKLNLWNATAAGFAKTQERLTSNYTFGGQHELRRNRCFLIRKVNPDKVGKIIHGRVIILWCWESSTNENVFGTFA